MRAVTVTIVMAAFCAWPCGAHSLLSDRVQHHIALEMGARNMDVRLELVLFADRAHALEQEMDADSDGQVSRREEGNYLRELAKTIEKDVTLRVGEHELELIALYSPRLKRSVERTPGHAHESVRIDLVFFARTPPSARSGDEIVVRYGLWKDVPAIHGFTLHGRDGLRFAIENREINGEDEGPMFRARLVNIETKAHRVAKGAKEEIHHD
jgi:hypothetical protein